MCSWNKQVNRKRSKNLNACVASLKWRKEHRASKLLKNCRSRLIFSSERKKEKSSSLSAACSSSILNIGKTKKKLKLLAFSPYWIKVWKHNFHLLCQMVFWFLYYPLCFKVFLEEKGCALLTIICLESLFMVFWGRRFWVHSSLGN